MFIMLSRAVQAEEREWWDFGQLQLSLRGIRILNRAPTVKFVSRLYLDGNHLLSLSGIEQFLNLEVLHFDYNYVSLPNQLNKIVNPFFMREISFIANPIQSHPALTHENLKETKFTRLSVLNPFHRLAQNRKQICKHREKDSNNPEQTERRKPKYSVTERTTRRAMAGKIYCTRTASTPKQQEETRGGCSKQTKESTGKHSVQESIIEKRKGVAAFELWQRIQEAEKGDTARFEDDTEERIKLGEQFLNQEKDRLAGIFHRRCLLEKCFKTIKNSHQIEISNDQGISADLINNHIETLRFGFIKLRAGKV